MENHKCNYCNSSFNSNNGLNTHTIYCSSNPSRQEKSQKWLEAMAARKGKSINGWQKINWDEIPFENLSKEKKRQRLLKECNYECSICGFNKTRSCGSSILEIDHIDGNHQNNSKDNLRVLCPNCHALTPNYRNWGRTSKQKSSLRLRRENAEYEDFLDSKKSKDKEVKKEFENKFIEKIKELHSSQQIDFTKNGWIKKVAIIFNEAQQVTSRRIKKLMPEFYEEHCYNLSKKYKSMI